MLAGRTAHLAAYGCRTGGEIRPTRLFFEKAVTPLDATLLAVKIHGVWLCLRWRCRKEPVLNGRFRTWFAELRNGIGAAKTFRIMVPKAQDSDNDMGIVASQTHRQKGMDDECRSRAEWI